LYKTDINESAYIKTEDSIYEQAEDLSCSRFSIDPDGVRRRSYRTASVRFNPAVQSETPQPLEDVRLKEEVTYDPRNSYSIFINYELGMHCVGFDVSYCCIIAPYNSVQAQVVRAGLGGEMPRLLSPDDKVKLYYHIEDNSYSEGNKMYAA